MSADVVIRTARNADLTPLCAAFGDKVFYGEYLRQHLPSVPLLTHLKVRPEYRDHGIGARLVDAVEADLRGRSYSRVALAVTTDNTEASGPHERLDYADWGYGLIVCKNEVELFDGEESPEKCLVLVKSLITRATGTARRSSRLSSPSR